MKIKLKFLFFVPLFLCVLTSSVSVQGAAPYQNYTYSEGTGELSAAPQAYLPERIIYAADLGISDFKNPSDIFCDRIGCIYILDSGNSRVVVINSDYTLKTIFNFSFDTEPDGMKDIVGAEGIFVDSDYIYIADTSHSRIAVADYGDGHIVKFINAPEADALGDDFVFKPIGIAADGDKLLYVVGEGTYEGIINMDFDGEFLGFFGSNTVSTSAWDLFWRRFSTKEQRKTMLQLVPQDFSGIDIDGNEFILTTTYTAQNNSMVKRLNPGGSNVIRNQSKTGIVGDPGTVWSGTMSGKSSFSDIASGPDNIYACLDYKRGKIFCYDNDGYLLYNFGTISDQLGGFSAPNALTYLGDNSSIAVLDKQNGSITVFAATDYAKAINAGIHYERTLEYDTAFEYWNKVVSLNSNCDFAHNALGQIYFNNEDYAKAMQEFRAASNKTMFSKAKKEMRSDWIYENIRYIMLAVVFLILILMLNAVRKFLKKRKKHK